MSDFGLLIHRYMRYDSGTVTSAEAEFSCNEVVLKPYWIISKLTVQYNTAAADIVSDNKEAHFWLRWEGGSRTKNFRDL